MAGMSVIKNSSFPSKHSNSIIEEYFIIVNDSFKLTILAIDDDDRYLIMGLEVKINKNNYIHKIYFLCGLKIRNFA